MIKCKAHIQNIGWTDFVEAGKFVGTTGKELRLEAIIIQGVDSYRVHVQDVGWMAWVNAGEIAGTIGQGKRIEAIQVKGASVRYRVHTQNVGWMNWADSGEIAGTIGGGLRVEAFQILQSGDVLSVDDVRKSFTVEPKPEPKPEPPKPLRRLAGKKICLNPGHGGSDPGAVGEIKESDGNLKVVLILGNLLTAEGAEVVYTRTSDVWMALSTRAAIANSANADMFVSVHHNGASSPTANGSETICYPGSQQGMRLATLVLNGLCNRLGTYRRGVIQRDDSDVTYTEMVAIITEAFFVSNPNECAMFNNGGAEKEAQGILDGILAYYGV